MTPQNSVYSMAVEKIVKITWLSLETLLMVSKGDQGALEFEEFTDEPSNLKQLVSRIKALNKRVIVDSEINAASF